MGPRTRWIFAVAALVAGACLDTQVPFTCAASAECGDQGVCEPTGHCSFPDPACASGRRYGRHGEAPRSGTCTSCGDGKRDPGEECDDGNGSDFDGCLTSCRFARCGDRIIRAGVEECDDGNEDDGDGCSSACLRCTAGNAVFTWPMTRHCYARHDRASTWEEAARACERDGAHLVTFGADAEAYAVGQRLLPSSTGWIGLRDESRTGVFTWVTGEPLLRLAPWASASDRPWGSCVTQRNRDLAGTSCSGTHRFVCEQRPWSVRPLDNHAYRIFHGKLPYAQARDACAALGAHLVTLADAEEHGFIGAEFHGTYWLGASRETHTAPFQWVTGERFVFANFLPGEPNLTGPVCLAMTEDRKWRDRDCKEANAFVCERE